MALHTRQRRAETVVDTVPKSEMTGLIPFEIERLGAGVSIRVSVGRGQADDHLFTGRDRHTSKSQRCSGIAKCRMGTGAS